jgi:hypothetical protein
MAAHRKNHSKRRSDGETRLLLWVALEIIRLIEPWLHPWF